MKVGSPVYLREPKVCIAAHHFGVPLVFFLPANAGQFLSLSLGHPDNPGSIKKNFSTHLLAEITRKKNSNLFRYLPAFAKICALYVQYICLFSTEMHHFLLLTLL